MLYAIVECVRAIRTILSSNFFRGSFAFGVASFAVSFLNYIFNLIVARGFELSQYGEYMSALSYSALLAVPFSALNIVVIARMGVVSAEKRSQYAQKIHSWLLSIFKEHAVYLLLLSMLFVYVVVVFANITFMSALFILSVVLSGIFVAFYLAIFQAKKQFIFAGLYLGSISLVKVVAGVFILYFNPSLVALYLIITCANLLGIALGAWYIGVMDSDVASVAADNSGKSIALLVQDKKVWLPTVAMLGIVGMIQVDVVLVKYFFSAADAGLYAGLSLLGKMILYISSPVSIVAFTYFTAKESQHQQAKVALWTVVFLLFSGGFLSVLYFFYAELIVLLLFGEKFLLIAPYVWLCAIFGTLYSVVTLLAQYFLAKKSTIALVSLVGLFAQSLALLIWHDSFAQVLLANIIVSLSMILLFVLCHRYVSRKKTVV